MRPTMPVAMPAVALGLLLPSMGCPADPVPTTASASTTSSGDPSAGSTDPSGDPTGDPTSDSGEVEPWLEVGWGVSRFNAFEGTLPVVVGPQGLAMFSLPLRGAGFHLPPDPGFDEPDMPILQAWVDVEGYALTPDGHLNEVVDYPALFYPSFEDPSVLEGPAVWLVIPDGAEPAGLLGLPAQRPVEMADADGLEPTADHDLVIGEVPPTDGP